MDHSLFVPNTPSIFEMKIPALNKALALYNYVGDSSKSQLTIEGGDYINIKKSHPSGWWIGELKGTIGYFPINYVVVDTIDWANLRKCVFYYFKK